MIAILISAFPVYAVGQSTEYQSSPLQDIIAGISSVEDVYGKLDESTVPKILGYERAVEHTHIRRLYKEEGDDLNKLIFLNADGSTTAYMFGENFKYIDKNGAVVEKDTTLVKIDSGYTMAKNDVGLVLPHKVTDGISIFYEEYTLQLIPKSNKESAGELKENSVTYKNPFGYDEHLVYTPTFSGVKEDIVLDEYVSDTYFEFVIRANGLVLSKKDGKYSFCDINTKSPIFDLGNVILYDKEGKFREGKLDIKPIKEGSEYSIRLIPDEKFLSDPNTVYPVTIDPSITISDNLSGAGAIEDSPIYYGRPTHNHGTYKYNGVGTPDSTYGKGRTVVRLNSLISSSEYSNIAVNKITNVTFHVREGSGTATKFINLYPLINTTWTESTVKWNNIGSYSTSLNCGANLVGSGTQWSEFDITDLVKAWKLGNFYADAGFIMISSDEAANKNFLSSEYSANTSYRPYVEMTYTSTDNLLNDDTYYLNNQYCGDYLRYTASSATASSGLLSSLGNTIRWEIRAVDGGYVIRSKTDTTKYLGVPATMSSTSVAIVSITATTIPTRCIWDIHIAANGGCLVKNTYNSKYLYSNGNSVYTASSTGTAGTSTYNSRVWRIASTTYYGNSSSSTYRELSTYSSFPDYELENGQSRYFYIDEYYSNEIWCSSSTDFLYSVSPSGKVTVASGKLNAIERGVVTITATHKVTNRVKTFEVFVKNSLLTEADIDRLYDDFDELLGDGYANLPLYNILDVSDVVEDIVENDQTITNYCNQYKIPKEFVQSVLFREIWCYSVADAAADVAVQDYYAWMEGTGSEPLVIKTDSSTGLGQIFASTAIKALNHADDRGFINLTSQYDQGDWQDVWYVWKNLHDNNTYNIYCCALVILDCQYEFEASVPYEDFFDFSESQIKTILARYNGYGDAAAEYGDICYEYYEIFESINN